VVGAVSSVAPPVPPPVVPVVGGSFPATPPTWGGVQAARPARRTPGRLGRARRLISGSANKRVAERGEVEGNGGA
jgi:hypothetical protein